MTDTERSTPMAEKPCESYSGKMAGDWPCRICGWLYSEHECESCDHIPAECAVAPFGREVLAAILADRNFFESEESEWWCELLAKFGYVERIIYDPEKHGEHSVAEAGQKLWMFTDAMRAAAKVDA